MFCSSCGKEIIQGAAFCGYCGAKVVVTTEVPIEDDASYIVPYDTYAFDIAKCQKAADKGYAVAQYNLGQCYLMGVEAKRDHEKAVEWFTKASDQGDDKAQFMLGLCYANGWGVERDYHKTIDYYIQSSEKGNRDARKRLDALENE